MNAITQMEHLFKINPLTTVDNKSRGEPLDSTLDELEADTYEGIKKGAKYFKVKPRYPDKIGWNYEIMSTDPMIAGYQIEGCDKSGCINEIGFNPLLVNVSRKERKKVAFHEGYHEVQRGKRILSYIIYDSNYGKFKLGKPEKDSNNKYPFGDMITEGNVEVGVEKEVNTDTSYPVSYSLADQLNQNPYLNLNEIHKLADIAEKKLDEKLGDPYFNPDKLKPEEVPPELTKILFLFNETPGVQQLAHRYAVHSKTDIPYVI